MILSYLNNNNCKDKTDVLHIDRHLDVRNGVNIPYYYLDTNIH